MNSLEHIHILMEISHKNNMVCCFASHEIKLEWICQGNVLHIDLFFYVIIIVKLIAGIGYLISDMSGRIIRYGADIYYSMLCYSLHQHPRLGEPNLGLPLRITIGYPPEFFRPKEKVRNNKRRMQIIISPILQTKLLPSPLQDKESK